MKSVIDIRTVAKCGKCGIVYRRRAFLKRKPCNLCKKCRPSYAKVELMSEREKQIRDWLKALTPHELHLLKSRLIHEEQLKRRGIVITPKPSTRKE